MSNTKYEGAMIRVDIPIDMHQALRQFKEYAAEVSICKIWETKNRDIFKMDKYWVKIHKDLVQLAKQLGAVEREILDELQKKADKIICQEQKKI